MGYRLGDGAAAPLPHDFSNNYWVKFFRIAGYIPFISSVTGPVRIGIGMIGATINGLCIPLFALMGENELKRQSFENLKTSFVWIIRGLVESKPFIGNALAWSWDSLQDRLGNRGYTSDALYDYRFIPGISFFTGIIRTLRGISGTMTGLFTEAFFTFMHAIYPTEETSRKILAAHKFTSESFFEVPQGLIEAIPMCDGFCPPLASIAQRIELQKIRLWEDQSAR